jgi:putative addiction module killer protein
MIDIQATPEFESWFERLADARARACINARLRRMSVGNPGDVASVGNGVFEIRIHYGPGYRIYFTWRGSALVILLAGGTKGTQDRDIRHAVKLAREQ